jgi:hypothetical protein
MTQAGKSPAEVNPMQPNLLTLRRWTQTTRPGAGPSSLRHDVRPPSLRQAPDSFWLRLWFWLAAPAPMDAAPPVGRLPGIRDDFIAALADMGGDEAAGLRRRVQHSHSLRELWHLRAEVYRVVALHHSQAEAEHRVAELNRHFPTRAPRSGFMPL